MTDERRGTLGVLIPCRNEAAVIERKLANLARAQWPERGRPHRVVVVDDDSDDGTLQCAEASIARLFSDATVEAICVRNGVRPGKNGALCQGLAELADEVELVVVTDADVVLDEWALVNLARAFDEDERLGMACGAQRFVRELRDDGRVGGLDGGAPEVASTAWDRLTSNVRALESLAGILFSVHGQLLAWRAALDLRPGAGVAADDLDLMLTLRERHPRARVERLRMALFYERKTPPGDAAEDQALRRARAYLQVFRAHPSPPPGLLATLQWQLYRAAPLLVVASLPLYLLALAALAVFLWQRFGTLAALSVAPGILALALLDAGREWRSVIGVILGAMRAEQREPMPERWEMRRS